MKDSTIGLLMLTGATLYGFCCSELYRSVERKSYARGITDGLKLSTDMLKASLDTYESNKTEKEEE